jgi:hypothetical protein
MVLAPIVASSQTLYRKAIFYHHSTGGCFYNRKLLYDSSTPDSVTTVAKEMVKYNTAKGYTGSAAVSMAEEWIPVEGLDNNWTDWYSTIKGTNRVEYSTFPIIILKTCYIQQQDMHSAADIDSLKKYYRLIVAELAKHPDNFFVIWNNMPAPTDGNSDRAAWSAQFSAWCKDVLATGGDATFGAFPKNVYVFDVFRKLADPTTGYCDPSYGDPGDDHPSNKSVGVVTPQFVKEVFDAALAYEEAPNPVTLAAFTVAPVAGGARLEWSTVSEINNYGFWVEKQGANSFAPIPGSFQKGAGTTNVPHVYAYTDSSGAGTMVYRLKQQDVDGTLWYSEPRTVVVTDVSGQGTPPRVFALGQNYPNPFNPGTMITYALPAAADVRLSVYDMLGREVSVLVDGRRDAGEHRLTFDGSALASGVYVYRLRAGDFVQSRRLVLLK